MHGVVLLDEGLGREVGGGAAGGGDAWGDLWKRSGLQEPVEVVVSLRNCL